MLTSRGQALSKLLFFLVILPASLTYWHLTFTSQKTDLCFVTPAYESPHHHVNQHIYGVYNKAFSFLDEGLPFIRVSGLSQSRFMWPSIAQVSSMLAIPRSVLRRIFHQIHSKDIDEITHICYDDRRWCLESTSHKFCSASTSNSFAPISGVWSNVNTDGSSIKVLHQGPTTPKRTYNEYERASERADETIDFLMLRPVTSILLGLQSILFFIYWNGHLKPDDVAKVYNDIVIHGELWRAFSGATAHFDPLHFGFNMISLHSLGIMLEGSFGSIPFLLYNVSLIAITTAIMMLIVNLAMKRSDNTDLGDTRTIGFSGVLFAWMVVASLESSKSCPIPFARDVCFETYEIKGFRFNIGPIIQMCITQAILKRSSFEGHLAGVLAGFALHWNLLRLDLFQPAVLLPALHLAHLWQWRHLIPVTKRCRFDRDIGSGYGDVVDLKGQRECHRRERGPSERMYGCDRERAVERIHLMIHIRNALVTTAVLSSFYDPFSVLLCTLFFHFCIQSLSAMMEAEGSVEYTVEKGRLGTLWKGFILSCTLTIMYDSMSLAGWILASDLWMNTPEWSLGLACILLAIRITIQMVALTLACHNLSDIGEMGRGIFVVIFGSTVLDSARTLAKPPVVAFAGRGRTLGGTADASMTV